MSNFILILGGVLLMGGIIFSAAKDISNPCKNVEAELRMNKAHEQCLVMDKCTVNIADISNYELRKAYLEKCDAL